MSFKFLAVLFSLYFACTAHYKQYETVDLIIENGYQAQSFIVKTSDGYLLTIHRVKPKNGTVFKPYPCFLVHGALGSSNGWIQLQNDSLPFILSDAGYDVYLGNVRGTQYSSHVNFDKDSKEFWDFSWHEMGIRDIPDIIDFILNYTGAAKLNYIGHSQGTTICMVMLSSKPEYNQKINQVHLLSPATFVAPQTANAIFTQIYLSFNTRHDMVDFTARFDALYAPFLNHNFNLFGTNTAFIPAWLHEGGDLYDFKTDLNAAMKSLGFATMYSSRRQVLHYMQSSLSGEFKQYDHGIDDNYKNYGTKKPPAYNLTNVVAPVYIYLGDSDKLVDESNARTLESKLPNVKQFIIIKKFNHNDYVASRAAIDEIYVKIISFMNV